MLSLYIVYYLVILVCLTQIKCIFQLTVNYFTDMFFWSQEEACKKCFEEVVDNLCIVFDLKEFGLSCMDYQMIKNLIWLLSRHYPERLGVCLVLNAPTLFSGCWGIIKGWCVWFLIHISEVI